MSIYEWLQGKWINVLGVAYKITVASEDTDPRLMECDGYTDISTKDIVVFDGKVECPKDALGDMEVYIKNVIRHEIIHAFIYESGINELSPNYGAEHEAIVDFFAMQFHKIRAVYDYLGV